MTKVYNNEQISEIDRVGRVYEDIELSDCDLSNVSLSITDPMEHPSIVRNVKALNCAIPSHGLKHAIFEDVFVDGLRAHVKGRIDLVGCTYRHVTICGKLSSLFLGFTRVEELNAKNLAYYNDVDWALDISKASFGGEVTLFNVPGDKIVRNPETQVLVTKERAQRIDFESLDFGDTGFGIGFRRLVGNYTKGITSEVLVAPSRGPHKDMYMRALDVLRSSGLAVPEDEVGPLRKDA